MKADLLKRLRGIMPSKEIGRDVSAGAAMAVAFFLVGSFGWRVADARAQREEELRALLAASDAWMDGFLHPNPEESQRWDASARAFDSLQLPGDGRLALLETLTRRAAAAGIRDARVSFTEEAAGESWRQSSGWSSDPAGYGIRMTFSSSYGSAVEVIRALPPTVEVRSLHFARITSTAEP